MDQTVEYIDGVVAINTVSAPIVDNEGKSYFPPDNNKHVVRKTAGLSGSAIKHLGKEVVANLAKIRDEHPTYKFDILAVEGVMSGKDVDDYLQLGANGVLACTGAMLNPDLAIQTRLYLGSDTEHNLTTIIGEDEKEKEVMFTKKERDDMMDEIEPGYVRWKIPRLPLTKELIESLAKITNIPILKDLLEEMGEDDSEDR